VGAPNWLVARTGALDFALTHPSSDSVRSPARPLLMTVVMPFAFPYRVGRPPGARTSILEQAPILLELPIDDGAAGAAN
jgi:hypothetical protein